MEEARRARSSQALSRAGRRAQARGGGGAARTISTRRRSGSRRSTAASRQRISGLCRAQQPAAARRRGGAGAARPGRGAARLCRRRQGELALGRCGATRAVFDSRSAGASLPIEVQALRASLDPQLNPNFRPYPARQRLRALQQILAPATPLLEGVHHVMIVPDGALAEPAGRRAGDQAAGARSATSSPITATSPGWRAIMRSPCCRRSSSLRALRQFAAKSKAPSPFLGVGDPVLTGKARRRRAASRTSPRCSSGELADTDKVRALPPLPETADELRSVAEALRAPDERRSISASARASRCCARPSSTAIA